MHKATTIPPRSFFYRTSAAILFIAFFSAFANGYSQHSMAASASSFAQNNAQQLFAVDHLTIEYKQNPLAIDVDFPRMAWQLISNKRNVSQSAYQIQVSEQIDFSKATYDSGKVISDQSIQLPFTGVSLQSGKRYFWRIKAWDQNNHASKWSPTAFWEMGLLKPSDWQANWIEADIKEDKSISNPPVMMRTEFLLDKPIESARAYVTSHGIYEMHINGNKVGDELFTPGWTSYEKRLQYQTFDVTNHLQRGKNAVGVMIGDGWFRGNLVFKKLRNIYGDTLALISQIVVTYTDGTTQIIASDDSWKASNGPILMSEIYHGETYDARKELSGWDKPNFDDKNWHGVLEVSHGKEQLIAPEAAGVKAIERIKPIELIVTPSGETVLDFGQNMVGYIEFSVSGKAGDKVVLRHAETLDKAGNFYVENLRLARQTIDYTLKGGERETYRPFFTFQGFRYVSVDQYPGDINTDDFEAVVIHSDLPRGNSYSTSKPLVNQLQSNILWSQKGNFLDIPTDCPQRNERLGWTGDAQVFIRTAAFNMNVAGFFSKWLKDLAVDQKPSGSVTHIVPDAIRERAPFHGAAAWGDAAVIIPWTLYQIYADEKVLVQQYDSMQRWVAFQTSKAGDNFIWTGTPQFGDWLAFSTNEAAYPGATTGKDYVATAFYAHSVDLMSKIATVLGKHQAAKKYRAQFTEIKSAFNKEFVTQTGRVAENTQTAYALALQFDLLPESIRESSANRLARNVRARKHLTTGFVGTPHLTHALSRYGHIDEAYMLLNRERYPSWLYPVSKGATTIWERWDGIKPNGEFQAAKLNSLNHYAYGAIGEWMYRVMAGLEIDPSKPGYKHFYVQPKPGGGFTHVDLSYQSQYGQIQSNWLIDEGQFSLTVEIPVNTTATIKLPKASLADVSENGSVIAGNSLFEGVKQSGDEVWLSAGSGTYTFRYPWASESDKAPKAKARKQKFENM